MNLKRNRLVFFVILAFLFIPLFAGITVRAEVDRESEYSDFSDMNGKKIAMLTGAPFEELIKSKVPEVGSLEYFPNLPDMTMALKAKKIDAYLMNNALAELSVNKDESLAIFPENLGENTFGIAFAKGSKEREKWQQAFNEIDQEAIKELWDKWTGADYSIKTIPDQSWPGTNGTVKAAVCDTLEPMSYVADGKLVGFDVELILMMAEKLDVHVDFVGMEFASIMSEVESGKALLGAGSIIATDDRKEVMDFVEYYPAAFVLVTRSNLAQDSSVSLVDKVKQSFYRTFVKESRYKMILSGLFLSCLIAVTSGVMGLVLAFLLVILRHKDIKFFNKLISVFSSIITGVPVVVILMVLYYIVFGFANVPAVLVAIIGFTIIFGIRVFGVIWNALRAVDPGQREAALALGYSEKLAFRKVVLPQARNIYLPLIRTQFVMLFKETSVAGYITVVDLTRAGDLIRSRTMDAFFPLISIAVIYFVLAWVFAKVIDFVDFKTNTRKGNRKIKGVD